MLTEEKVLNALKDVKDPELNRSLVELNMVRDIEIKGEHISLTVVLTISGCPLKATIEDDVINKLKETGAQDIQLTFDSMTDEERAELAAKIRKDSGQAPSDGQKQTYLSPLLNPQSGTKFVAVTSGKGGVGKSTVTVNLAKALTRLGKKVGIIDADIYGFSVPDMLGVEQRPVVIDSMILPVEKHGIKVMSMGFFVENNSPVIWRGPMLGKMLRNFFGEVHWGELDYVLLDLPPGTGDVALDVHQLIPQSKEIVITTPHATAAFVAARAGAMAKQTDHEVMGVVENMAYYALPDGSRDYIFGKGGGEKLAKKLEVPLLAQIPLGQPQEAKEEEFYSSALYAADSVIGQAYTKLAQAVAENMEKSVSATD